jgi:sulfate transport system ATP-binding protein
MEVADRIAVMDEGRIQQVGAPREVYEHPVNRFVMTFVGPTTTMGDALVRPHDLELGVEPNGVTTTARIERLVHLGFEVRVELQRDDDGGRMSAQVTRDLADELGLEPGGRIFVRPKNERVFS